MTVKHNLQERTKELRSLMATAAGREEIQELASRYGLTVYQQGNTVYLITDNKS